tara:strand:+ start:51290 stop:51484 length:195 start_codon:yes stop_codon:yes gene_type:complete
MDNYTNNDYWPNTPKMTIERDIKKKEDSFKEWEQFTKDNLESPSEYSAFDNGILSLNFFRLVFS